MALINGLSNEFLSPVPILGQLNPGEVTVNHTGGQWLFVDNVRVYYLLCAMKSYIMEV